MIKNIISKNKGIVVADALLAILIISIFIGVISTLIYNTYLLGNFVKRNSIATNYGIDIMEYIERLTYDEVTYDKLIDYINNTLDGSASKISAETVGNSNNLTTPYKVSLYIEKYNETSGNTDKADLIQTITVDIKYKLGDDENTLHFERVKKR